MENQTSSKLNSMKDLDITSVLPNEIYNDESISNQDVSVFLLMQKNRIWKENEEVYFITSVSEVKRRLVASNTASNNTRWMNDIKSSIARLVEIGFITGLYDTLNEAITTKDITFNDAFYFKIDEIKGGYFIIHQKEVDRLLHTIANLKISKVGILRYYIAIQRVINCPDKFGYLSQRYCNFVTDNFSTIQHYNEILSHHKLVLLNNSYASPSRHLNTTFFGVVGDEDNFNSRLLQVVSENKLIEIDKVKMKKKISKTQKENHQLKSPATIDENNDFESEFIDSSLVSQEYVVSLK